MSNSTRRHVDACTVDAHLAPHAIDPQEPHAFGIARQRGPPQSRANALDELVEHERCRDVIIGAEPQRADLLGRVAHGAQDDDGNVREPAQLRHQSEAVCLVVACGAVARNGRLEKDHVEPCDLLAREVATFGEMRRLEAGAIELVDELRASRGVSSDDQETLPAAYRIEREFLVLRLHVSLFRGRWFTGLGPSQGLRTRKSITAPTKILNNASRSTSTI